MLRVLLVLTGLAGVAYADAPTGYRCGAGKPNPGIGCTCPEKLENARDDKNVAICAAVEPAEPTCANAAGVFRKQMRGALAKTGSQALNTEETAGFVSESTAAMQARCQADQWSAAVIACIAKSKNTDQTEVCSRKLSQKQKAGLERELAPIVRRYQKKPVQAPEPPKLEPEPAASEPAPPVVQGASIEIREQVHFTQNGSTIKPESFVILDEVAGVLTSQPAMKIEIGGHTDSQGNDKSNLQLSQGRADAVLAYLLKKGIAGSRMVAKGYGETQPRSDNRTAKGRAENRRIEFRILEQ
jgi:outer membrane protein OmpA-like peptidoglycan-associated protein